MNNPVKQSLLDSLVSYAHSMYKQPYDKCQKEIHLISKNCEECLKDTHYNECDNSYQCKNVCFVYACKYSHRYATEIAIALSNLSTFSDKPKILSFGCGPASELCAIDSFRESGKFTGYSFLGVDQNNNWESIHSFYKNYKIENVNVTFCQNDVMSILSNRVIERFDIIIMNYFLSDMVKYQTRKKAKSFIQNMYDIIETSHNKPAIIYNDLNLDFKNKNTGSISVVTDTLCKLSGYNIKTAYFHNDKYDLPNPKTPDYTRHGFPMHSTNKLFFNITSECWKYSPYKYCASAQIILEHK